MKTYRIHWLRSDGGYLDMTANSEEEAREKFEQGDYKNIDLVEIDGNITAEEVEELTNNNQ